MRPVIGASKRDPLGRLLAGTAGALRARQQLPARDPRRASSRWLRPNWPDALLLTVHRRRLVEALMRDQALRQEVRDRLRLPVVTALAADLAGAGSGDRMPEDASELLAAAIAAADDPVAVLESAATDPDPSVAGRGGTVPERRAVPAGRRTPARRRGRSAGSRRGRPEPEVAPPGTPGRGRGEVPAPAAAGPAEGGRGAAAPARCGHASGPSARRQLPPACGSRSPPPASARHWLLPRLSTTRPRS